MSYSYKAFFAQWFVFDFQLEPICMCTNERDAAVVCGALNAKESTEKADNSAKPKLPDLRRVYHAAGVDPCRMEHNEGLLSCKKCKVCFSVKINGSRG